LDEQWHNCGSIHSCELIADDLRLMQLVVSGHVQCQQIIFQRVVEGQIILGDLQRFGLD